jgi:hypothetical protein
MSEYTDELAEKRRGTRRGGLRWTAAAVIAVLVAGFSVVVTAGPAMGAVSPANDDISSATLVTALPFTATQDNTAATQGASDPTPSCGVTSSASVWYSFTPTANGTIDADTSAADQFPPDVTAYTGPPNATAASPLTEASCSTSGLQMNVTGGTTYYFMVSGEATTFTFTIQAIVAPSNDDISNATPVTALPFSTSTQTLTATHDPHDPTPSCTGPGGFSVWFSYTPVTDGAIEIGDAGVVYSGPAHATDTSPLTELGCPFAAPAQIAVTAGTTYYVMVASFVPEPAFTFTIQAVVPPANDDIAGAVPVTALPFSATQDSLTATADVHDPTPSCGAAHQFSVWYSYTPAADGTIDADTSGGDFFPPSVTAYTGPPNATTASPLTEAGCSTGGLQMNVTGGMTYYFLLGSNSPRPSFTFAVAAMQAPIPPVNDDIANATPVTSVPFTATQDSLTATQNANDPSPSCGSPNQFTVWYSFTPTASGAISVTTTAADGNPPTATAYSGPPQATATTPLTEVSCSGANSGLKLNVTAGTTYYFMLGSFDEPASTFDLDLETIIPPPNDDIANATPVTDLPFSATQDSLTATADLHDPSSSNLACGSGGGPTVWYSYTPTANGTIDAGTSGGFFPPVATAYSGPANATSSDPLTQVDCSNAGLQMNVTAGTAYYFMLTGASPTFTFSVQAITPPPNDDIANATPIPSVPFSATQDTLTATQDPHDPGTSCGVPNDFTVWYSYTPSADGTIQLDTSAVSVFRPSVAVFSGPSGATDASTLTEVACSGFQEPLQTKVSAGTTYYVMVGSLQPNPTFTLSVTVAEPFTAPSITAPPVNVSTDPGQCDALVTYGGLSVSANPTPTIDVFPFSGSLFGVGTTSVSVEAFNLAGMASTTFPVTVTDTEKPHLATPGPITVDATGPGGATVDYPAPTATDNCPNVAVTSIPASGSRFAIGRHKVKVTATDAAGNQTTKTFVVNVKGAPAQLVHLAKSVEGVGVGRFLPTIVSFAQVVLAQGHVANACIALAVFDIVVASESPRFIPDGTAKSLTGDADRIRNVLCGRPMTT